MDIKQYRVSGSAEMGRLGELSYRFIAHLIGLLMGFESLLLCSCCCVSLIYGEKDMMSFVISFAICLSASALLMVIGQKKKSAISRYEGYIVVGLSWVFFTIFGMLPYLIGGYIPSVTDAFFETMSGFTTTGATILDNIESMPHGILFWRSLTQWIGGLGIVFFTIVLMPGFGASSQMLYLSEATGVTHNKLYPKTRVMARYIFVVYILLTAIETVLLKIGGMSLYDAICHSMTTTATGGFSTKQESIAYWHSSYIEYVVSGVMLLSAINFSLYIVACKGGWKQIWKNAELKWFVCGCAHFHYHGSAHPEQQLWNRGSHTEVIVSGGHLSYLMRFCYRRLQPVATIHLDATHLCHAVGRMYGIHQWRNQESQAHNRGQLHTQPVPADTASACLSARKSRRLV